MLIRTLLQGATIALLRPMPLLAVEMAGFGSPVILTPVVEMAGFATVNTVQRSLDNPKLAGDPPAGPASFV